MRPQTALYPRKSRDRFRLPIKIRSNDHVARHLAGIRPGQRGAAGDIDKTLMSELDQELDMLAPDEDHPVSSFPAHEVYNFLGEERCDRATAAFERAQFSHPGLFEPNSLATG